jgi:hypothetical protein
MELLDHPLEFYDDLDYVITPGLWAGQGHLFLVLKVARFVVVDGLRNTLYVIWN